MQKNHYRLRGFRANALAIAVAATLPVTAVYADNTNNINNTDKTLQELPTAQATGQNEDSYKVDAATSPKYTQPLLDTAKTLSVIPQSVIKDRNIDSLRDVLRNVPGISFAAGEGGTPTGDSMTIRGFDARNSIMIDNVRDIAGYTRDVYNVEAVEVAKGPSSAVYGRGSAGGSVNLQTKTARLDQFTDASLRLGSESDYRAQLDSNKVIGETTALRINLLTDDGEVPGRDQVNNAKVAIAGSLATGLGTDSRLSVSADYQEQDNLPDYGLPWVSNSASADPIAELATSEGKAPPVEFSNFYGNIFRDFEDIQAQSLTAKYEKDLNQTTTLRILGRVGSIARQSVVTAPRFFALTTSSDVRLSDEKTRDTKDSLKVIQVDLIGQYQTGGVVHNTVIGAEVAAEKFERWHFVDLVDDNLDSTPELIDLYTPNSRVAFTGQYGRDGKDEEATGDTTAIYLFDTLTFNPQWELSLGLRYDIFKTEYFFDLSGSDPTLKLEAEDKQLSWNLGLVYKPAANGSIYFGAGNAFSPSAEDLTASSRDNSNQNDLEPEEIISYEIGTKWELLDGKLFTSAALFLSEKTNGRTDDPFFNADSPEGDRRNFDTLDGKQRVSGLELSAAGQLSDRLSLSMAYAFQQSEVVNAEGDDEKQEGEPLARTPEHAFSAWGRYDFNEKWAAGAGAQYMAERYNSSDPDGREKAGDYVLFDMMASYQVSDKWVVQLNAENLLDEQYEDQLGGGHFVPGQGRFVSLSTHYSF